jgi:ribonuclease D
VADRGNGDHQFVRHLQVASGRCLEAAEVPSAQTRQLGIAIAVAAWREQRAQTKNMPRQRIIKDDAIGELAQQVPKDKAALSKLRALPKGLADGGLGDEILQAVKRGLEMDKDELPQLAPPKGPQPEGASAIADVLKLGLKVVAERENIAPRLIANASDLEELAGNGGDDLAIMHGWRRELFGELRWVSNRAT